MLTLLKKDADQLGLFGGSEPVGLTPKARQRKRLKAKQLTLFPTEQASASAAAKVTPKGSSGVKGRRARKGGEFIAGKQYKGGQWIPKAAFEAQAAGQSFQGSPKKQPQAPALNILQDQPEPVSTTVDEPAALRPKQKTKPAPKVPPATESVEATKPFKPKTTLRALRGMSSSEYGQFKEMAEIAIPFARISQNKQKYAAGNINIKPPANQGYKFVEDQKKQVADFAETVGLIPRGYTWDEVREGKAGLGSQGFSFLWLDGDHPELNSEAWQKANPEMKGKVQGKEERNARALEAEQWMRTEATEKTSAFNLAEKFGVSIVFAKRVLKKLEAEGAITVDGTGGYTGNPYYRRVESKKETPEPSPVQAAVDGALSDTFSHPKVRLEISKTIQEALDIYGEVGRDVRAAIRGALSTAPSIVREDGKRVQGSWGPEAEKAIASRIIAALSPAQSEPVTPPAAALPEPAPAASAPSLSVDADSSSTKQQKQRLQVNRQVEALLSKNPGGPYSQDELSLLAKYSGKGGITDDEGSLSEYYTRPDVARHVIDLLYQNGFQGGTALEPSCGNGVFLSQFKDNPNVLPVGVELSETSGKAAAALNPHAEVSAGISLERFLLDNPDFSPDAIVGNVPFGTRTIDDLEAFRKVGKGWKDNGDFFVHESMSRLKSGGVMALIVPHGITSGSNHQRLRGELIKQGRVLGVHRLPNTAFEHTGTKTVTDVLVMQKHPDSILNAIANGSSDAIEATRDDDFIQGNYFAAHPEHVLGEREETTNQFGGKSFTINGKIEDALRDARPMAPDVDYAGLNVDATQTTPKSGDTRYINGRLYRLEGSPLRWHLVDEAESVAADEGLDPAGYGTESRAEAIAILSDPGRRALIHPDYLEAYARLAGEEIHAADVAMLRDAAAAVGSGGSTPEREKIAHAMVLAGHLKLVQQGGADDMALEQSLGMLQRYRELYGNPATDKDLSKLSDRYTQLLGLQGAFNPDGKISDYFANHDVVADQVQRTHGDAGAAMGEAFRAAGGEMVGLEDIQLALSDQMNDSDLQAALAADPAVGYMGGGYMPIDRLLVGNGFNLIDAMLMEAETLPKGSPLRGKLEDQIGIIRSRLEPRPLEDMTTPFWAVGSWIPVEALNEFLEDRGYRAGTISKDINGTWDSDEFVSGVAEDILTTMNRGRISHGQNTKEAKEAIAALEKDFGSWLAGSDYRLQVEEAYNAAFNGDLPQTFSGESLDIAKFDQYDGDEAAGVRKKRLHHYQTSTIRQMAEQGRGIIALGVGLGKAQPLDANILTPAGWRRMGEMRVGDEVINSQGGVSRVTGVFPQGEKDIYKVIMSDGTSAECCDEHLWAVQTGNDRIRKGADVYRIKELREFKDDLRTPAGKLRYFIPIVKPIQFPDQELPLDPYLLGVLIGDGSTRSTSIDLATGDDEIVDAIASLLPEGVRIVHNRNANYRIAKEGYIGISGQNPAINALRALGLWGCRGEDKFIPDPYKFASVEQRLALLQGLMDSDGSVFFNKTSSYVSFSSTSKQLAEDVQFLIQSFGGKTPIFTRRGEYAYKGEKRIGRENYGLNISLPPGVKPFRLTRKLDQFVERSKFLPSRSIVDVVVVGRKDAQCIAVDAPDHLYITDNCIVTHNTASSIGLALHLKEVGRAKKPAIVVPKSVLANWLKEISFWAPEANVMILGQTQQFWASGNPMWEVPGHNVLTKGGNPKTDGNGNYLLTYRESGETVAMTQEQVDKLSSLTFKDDSRAEKERKMQQLKQNSYDIVLMSAPVFQDIGLNPHKEGEYLQDLAQAGSHLNPESTKTHKELEKIETAKRQLAERSGEKTDNIFFEDLGIDCLIHDEAHSLKNLFGTQRTGEVAFLSQAQSNRSLDFYNKARYIREQNNNQNVFLLTATPTTNNPLEAFNMLQHVCPEEFESRGIRNVDDFLSMFGKIENVTVPGVDLQLTEKQGLVGFKNLKDLRKLFGKYCRMQSAKDVNLPIPEEQTQDHMVDMTAAQKELYEDLKVRAQNITGDGGDGQDHIFSVISDMDKAAIDLRYYNESNSGFSDTVAFPKGEKSPKIAACADQVMSSRNSNQGKQIVFCDAVQLHEGLKQQLVAAGYPEDEIKIVNAKTAKRSSDRQKISQAYNDGRISLVIGNTATMGEGMNFQIGTTDIHHLTTPWTPAAIEQRNGRGVRQGNELDGVGCHYYHAKGSFDGYRKGVIERKRGWIDDLWKGSEDEATNVNTGGLSMDEINIMMSDDPEAARAALESNKELQLQRHKEKMARTAMRQFGQVQTMKMALSKMTPESRESNRGRALEGRLRAAVESLGRNEYFPHKNLLNGSTPAYVGTDGTVLQVGDHIQKNDGAIYRITGIDNAKNKLAAQMVSGTEYQPSRIDDSPAEFGYKSIGNTRSRTGIAPISFDDSMHAERVINGIDTYGEIAALSPEAINANRGRILDRLKNKGGYSRVPYLNPQTGLVEEGKLSSLPEGATMLFPHDGEALEHLVKTMASPQAGAEWKYHGIAEKLTNRTWHSGLGAELKPRIEGYRAQHAAMAEQGPKEGDRKTEGGVEYELRGSRWRRVGEDEAMPQTTPEPTPIASPRVPAPEAEPHPDPLGAIRDALLRIEADDAPDRGRDRNDMGWSAFTREFGKSLAAQVQDGGDLTPNQYRKAWAMLTRRHRPQAGHQATTEQLTEALTAQFNDAGEYGNARGTMELVDGKIHIKRPYNKSDLSIFRGLPGRRWDSVASANVIPLESFKDALAAFPESEMDIDPAIFEQADIHKEPSPKTAQGTVQKKGGKYHVSFDYDKTMVAQVKSLKRNGKQLGRWNNKAKTWEFPGTEDTLDMIMDKFPEFDLTKSADPTYRIAKFPYAIAAIDGVLKLVRQKRQEVDSCGLMI